MLSVATGKGKEGVSMIAYLHIGTHLPYVHHTSVCLLLPITVHYNKSGGICAIS